MNEDQRARRHSTRQGHLVAGVLIATWLGFAAAQQGAPRQGGILDVALQAEEAVFDNSFTTSGVVNTIAQHMFETLFAFDADFVPQPMLARGVSVEDGGARYVFELREGVRFHDGSELTADDVAASLERWMRVSVRGATAAAVLEGIEVLSDHSIEVRFTEPFAPFLSLLAYTVGGPVIFPAEIVERYPDTQVREYVGTGPFQFNEQLPDRYVSLRRFDGYQPVGAPPTGMAGDRVAYVDEIRFWWVPDTGTRIAGVQTGEYDFAVEIATDTYAGLSADPRVDTIIVRPERWPIFMLNKTEGLMTDRELRLALNAALDMEVILIAAAGDPAFWELNHNYMIGDTPWRTDAGRDVYNQADPERARQLASDAGYANEPIRWMVAGERRDHLLATQAAVAQLQAAGFNIDLQVVDQATLLDRRAQPGAWDVFTTQGGFLPDPVLLTVITDRFPGWWVDERRAELVAALNAAPTLDERQRIWEELHTYIYEEMPSIFVGEIYGLAIKSPNFHGYQVFSNKHFFWNTWLE